MYTREAKSESVCMRGLYKQPAVAITVTTNYFIKKSVLKAMLKRRLVNIESVINPKITKRGLVYEEILLKAK